MKPVIESIPSESAKVYLDYLLQIIFDATDKSELREGLKNLFILSGKMLEDEFFVYFGANHCSIHERNGSGEVMKERLLFIEF